MKTWQTPTTMSMSGFSLSNQRSEKESQMVVDYHVWLWGRALPYPPTTCQCAWNGISTISQSDFWKQKNVGWVSRASCWGREPYARRRARMVRRGLSVHWSCWLVEKLHSLFQICFFRSIMICCPNGFVRSIYWSHHHYCTNPCRSSQFQWDCHSVRVDMVSHSLVSRIDFVFYLPPSRN